MADATGIVKGGGQHPRPVDPEPLDFERDVPTTAADVEALREARRRAESICLGSLAEMWRLQPPPKLAERLRAAKHARKFVEWGAFEL